MTVDKAVCSRLEEYRDAVGLSQSALAQMVGVTQGFLSQVLKGKKDVSGKMLRNIASGTDDLNIRWLLTGKGDMLLPEKIYPPPSNGTSSGVEDTQQPAYHKEGKLERIERLLRDHETRLCAIEQKE